MTETKKLKDVNPESLESLFDLVTTRKHGVREGWLMMGDHPLCIVLTHEMTKVEAQEMIQLAGLAADSANVLPI